MPLITPMYYWHPGCEEAYSCPNQYAFGSELLAAPHIRPMDPDTRLSRQVVWLPEGSWYGFFGGQHYEGGRWHAVYGRLDEIPVYARAGAIVPLGLRVEWGGVENPGEMELHVFAGGDNRFELYEDDGRSTAYLGGKHCLTPLVLTGRPGELEFRVGPAQGDTSLVPGERRYDVILHGVCNPGVVRLSINGEQRGCAMTYCPTGAALRLPGLVLRPADELVIRVAAAPGSLLSRRDRRAETCEAMLRAFRLESWTKAAIGARLPEVLQDVRLLAEWGTTLADSQSRALIEVIEGVGAEIITNAGPRELLVLWNPGELPQMRYQVAAWDGFRLFNSEHGAVPRSRVIPLDGRARWKVRVDYLGMASLLWSR